MPTCRARRRPPGAGRLPERKPARARPTAWRRSAGPSCNARWPCWPRKCTRLGVQRGDRVVRVVAQHATHHRRVSRLRQPRRDLERVQPRHGAGGRARPLPPDRAQAAVRGGWAGLGRCHGARPARRCCVTVLAGPADPAAPGAGGRACGRQQPARPISKPSCWHGLRPSPRLARRCWQGEAPAGWAPRVAAFRPPAVDRVFQRHHRPAEAHRARPRRHRAGGAQGHACTTTCSPASQTGRAACGTLLLVQQHRLDHVERAARRRCWAAPPSACSTATRAVHVEIA